MNKTISKKTKYLNFQEISEVLCQKRPEIHDKYKIFIIGIFGSYSRNEQRENSDIDILISYGEDATLFNKFALMEFLEALFLTKVDLVAEKYIKPTYRDSIMRDLIRI